VGDSERPGLVTMDPHHVIATWRNTVIALWIDETPVAGVREAQHCVKRLAASHADGLAFIQVVCDGCSSLPAESRAAIHELLSSSPSSIRVAPVVFEGDGFRAATVRAIVGSIAAFGNYGFSHRVFATVPLACDSAAKGLGRPYLFQFARELEAEVAGLRELHRIKFPQRWSLRPKNSGFPARRSRRGN